MNKEIKEILDRLERIDHKEYTCPFEFADSSSFTETARCFKERKMLADYINNLQILYDKATTDLVKESHARMKLQEENDYLKDMVSNTELSNEIKKADKWSKRELYKINYQRLKANQRLQEENEKLIKGGNELLKENEKILNHYAYDIGRMIDYKQRIDKAIEYIKECTSSPDKYERFISTGESKELLNILQGSDKE